MDDFGGFLSAGLVNVNCVFINVLFKTVNGRNMSYSKLFVSVVFLSVLSVFIANGNPITNEAADTSRQCTYYDLASTFNLTIDKQFVAVYNSALCKQCMHKLLLFKALQLRFEIADFDDILFIWLTTERSDTPEFLNLQSKAGDIKVISLHDIDNDFFVAETVYTFDKCSRLTYELFPPWSELQYQLVKAALLSTCYDAPCGQCEEVDMDVLSDFLLLEKELTTTTDSGGGSSTEETQTIGLPDDGDDEIDNFYPLEVENNDTAYVINMQTIIPVEHVHHLQNNTYIKYNYIVFNSEVNSTSSLIDGHEHLSSDRTEILYDDQAVNTIDSNKTRIPEYLHNSEGLRFKVTPSEPANVNSTEKRVNKYLEVKQDSDAEVLRPTLSPNNLQNMTTSVNPSIITKLRKWISFRLISPFLHV